MGACVLVCGRSWSGSGQALILLQGWSPHLPSAGSPAAFVAGSLWSLGQCDWAVRVGSALLVPGQWSGDTGSPFGPGGIPVVGSSPAVLCLLLLLSLLLLLLLFLLVVFVMIIVY